MFDDFAIMFNRIKWFIIGLFILSALFFRFCATHKQNINTTQTYTDTLTNKLAYALSVQAKLRDSIQFLTIFYKDREPQIITDFSHPIVIHDTIRSKTHILDTFFTNQIIVVHDTARGLDTGFYLALPYSFVLQDSFMKLNLSIDRYKKSVDSLQIYNALNISTKITKSFFTDYNSISFSNSNPYVSTITPIYTYSVPTPQKKWVDRIGGFILGLGLGYIIRKN